MSQGRSEQTIHKTQQGDPRDTPNYTLREASGLLEVPRSTLAAWVKGRSYETQQGERRWPALLGVGKGRLLSFHNLVELQVLAALRREHGVSVPKVREALDYLRDKLGVERPLLHRAFLVDHGCNLFVEHYGHLIEASASGQVAMRAVLAEYLKTLDYDEAGWVRAWKPIPYAGMVSLDPVVAFGRPVLVGTRLPVEVLCDGFLAGDSPESLAESYQEPAERVEQALRLSFRRPRRAGEGLAGLAAQAVGEWRRGEALAQVARAHDCPVGDVQGWILQAYQAA